MEVPSFVVVMTATVTPSTGAVVGRSDPNLRREDYAAGLRFWLNHPDPRLTRIVLLENSGYDLSWFRALQIRRMFVARNWSSFPLSPRSSRAVFLTVGVSCGCSTKAWSAAF